VTDTDNSDGPAATDGGADGTEPIQSDVTDEDVDAMGRWLGRVARTAAANPGVVVAIAGILLASGFYAGTTLDVLADTEEFVPDDLPALLDLQQLRDRTGGGSDVQYPVLVSGDGLTDPETLRWMESFDQVAQDQPQVRGVETPADTIRQFNGGELPRTQAGVERVLDRMPPELRQEYYSDGYARIILTTEPGLTPPQVISLTENTETSLMLSRAPPGVDARLTGTSAIAPVQNYEQILDRNNITLLGIGFIFTLLLVYYRHPVKSVAPLVPMVFVVGWQGLYMAALGLKISPLGASLGALTVGIGAEYTIIVMERYFEERERGVAPVRAVEIASQRVGKAITVSGMTTILGFSALMLSPFPIVSDFGFLTVGVIFLTLVGALIIMPPTLVVLDTLVGDIETWRNERTQNEVT
jgi:hydrophobe/amphiphile efflux-3 (HAE3) family protein